MVRGLCQEGKEEIDLENARITKAGSTTKNNKPHITHLSAPAQEEIKRLTGEREGYVFTTNGKRPVSGISRMKARLDMLLGDDLVLDQELADPDLLAGHDYSSASSRSIRAAAHCREARGRVPSCIAIR